MAKQKIKSDMAYIYIYIKSTGQRRRTVAKRKLHTKNGDIAEINNDTI